MNACGACGATHTEVTGGGAKAIKGPQFCYQGEHRTKALLASNVRRVFSNAANLSELQAQLDSLPEDLVTLTVYNSSFYNESYQYTLEKCLPKLQSLQIVDVLTEETTPAIRSLRLQNMPDDTDLVVALPELRDVTIHYYDTRCDSKDTINSMLAAAT